MLRPVPVRQLLAVRQHPLHQRVHEQLLADDVPRHLDGQLRAPRLHLDGVAPRLADVPRVLVHLLVVLRNRIGQGAHTVAGG
jgi:hypothetical protein